MTVGVLEPGVAHGLEREVRAEDRRADEQEEAAGLQVVGRLLDDAVEHDAAVGAGVPRALEALGRQVVAVGRDVGRVRDDRIEALLAEGS